MKTTVLFSQLLHLNVPFSVASVEYKSEGDDSSFGKMSVHIHIDVDTSLGFRPENSVIHGYEKRVWRHLNLFQYPCYIHCDVPKYQDKESGSVKTLDVSWARPGAGFTLLFEDFAVELVRIHGCVAEVARQLDIYPQRLWKIVKDNSRRVDLEDVDMSKVRRIGYDETSRKKGHDYITCFIDLDTGELLYVAEGKGAETVVEFEEAARTQGLDKELVSDVSIDMSAAFLSGAEKVFPNAGVTIDKFHVSQLVQRAFDSIRKSFGKKEGGRIGKWIFLKSREELTAGELEELEGLLVKYPLLDKIYEMKNNFRILWGQDDNLQASAFLSFWVDSIRELKKKALTTLANTLDKHHQKIINVIESKITNAILEGFNSKIQTLKRKARGYKDFDTLMMMVKLCCEKRPT